MSSSKDAHMHSLQAMPDPWLQQLPPRLDKESLVPLLCTCRAMRDLVFEHYPSLSVEFKLPIPPPDLAEAQKALAFVCKHAGNVHLKIGRQVPANDITASAFLLLLGAAALRPPLRGLETITTAELSDLSLDAVVPPWLTYTCPHMTSLVLTGVTFTALPPPTTPIPQCTQLRQLQIGWYEADPTTPPSHWQHQLQALPALNHLIIHNGDDSACLSLEVCSAIGAQLTTLELFSGRFSDAAPSSELEHLASFPNLLQLQLAGDVSDEAMNALLNLPRPLHKFRCTTFSLQESYSDRPSPWVHLGFQQLCVDSFDRLPWEGVQSIQDEKEPEPGRGGEFIGEIELSNQELEGPSIEAARRLAVVVARCGGVQWRCATIQLGLGNIRSREGEVLAAVMPILASCQTRKVIIKDAYVTVGLLDAIAEHLCTRQLAEIKFSECMWQEGVMPHVLGKLHSVPDICVDSGARWFSATQLTVMCTYACRPVKVRLSRCEVDAPLSKQVKEFMAEAGHQHVTLLGWNDP